MSSGILKNTPFGNLHLLEGNPNKVEVLEKGGLDYVVEKHKLNSRIFTCGSDGHLNGGVVDVGYPYHVGVVRADTLESLGVVGLNYGIVQNGDVLDVTEVFREDGTASYVAAGAPNRGERIYVVMDTGHALTLGPDPKDQVRNFFFLTSSHDGSSNLTGYPSPVYVRGNTVLIFPDARHGAIRIRHSKNAASRLVTANKLLAKVVAYWERFAAGFEMLKDAQVTDETVQELLVTAYTPEDGDSKQAENVREAIFQAYKSGPASQMPYAKGTLLGLYFACAHVADHEATVRKSKRNTVQAAELYSKLIGTSAQKKAEALAFVLQMQRKFGGQ